MSHCRGGGPWVHIRRRALFKSRRKYIIRRSVFGASTDVGPGTIRQRRRREKGTAPNSFGVRNGYLEKINCGHETWDRKPLKRFGTAVTVLELQLTL